jgi:hypothetical protein
VQNHPLDNSALIESWRQKGISEDRITQAWREGMMGYERTMDPITGKMHNMPIEAYNGAKGGYLNPEGPRELLVKPSPVNKLNFIITILVAIKMVYLRG